LALLAYRATFVGDFRLHPRAARNGLGIGKEQFYAAVRSLKACGYLTREQTRGAGSYGRAREIVSLDAAPRRREGHRVHYRTHLEQAISVKALGTYLYLAAFARTFAVSSAQIQARFGWRDDGTARTCVNHLIEAGLAERRRLRAAAGRFAGVAYAARRPSKPDTAKPDTVKPDTVGPDAVEPGTVEPDAVKPDAYIRSNDTDDQSQQTIKADQQSKSTENQRRRSRKAEVVARARDNLAEDRLAELGRELARHDRARVLAPALLSPRGILPYAEMLRTHGDLARRVVLDILARFALDGAEPGKVKTWRYFTAPLAEAAAAAERPLNGLHPDELRASWRDEPIDPPF
jgi:hypothetical protein